MIKTIVVQWVPDDGMYGSEMIVISSEHPQYGKGSRFDFGFFSVATDEGYTIISLPMKTGDYKTKYKKKLKGE